LYFFYPAAILSFVRFRFLFAALFGALASCIRLTSATGADPPAGCDQVMIQAASTVENGYRPLADRCEGRYAAQVENRNVSILTLTVKANGLQPAGVGDHPLVQKLRLSWPLPPGGAAVAVRAVGVGFRNYYQMDTIPPQGALSYDWPTDVLAGLHLGLSDIVVNATFQSSPAGRLKKVLLPLSIGDSAGDKYVLEVLPGAALSDIVARICLLGPNQREVQLDPQPITVPGRPYFAGRLIEIGISRESLSPGYYHAYVSAIRTGDDAPLSADCWFYHSR
jgi:hypothetical protein